MRFDKAIRATTGKTSIDLGANIGKYTTKMARRARQVIAFEPDSTAYAALRSAVARYDNVRIEKAAAGTSDGNVLLYRHAEYMQNPLLKSQSSSVIATKPDVVEEGAEPVRQIDFVRYLEELNEDIGILKVDIEGAELDILEALFDRTDMLDRIDYIFAETHEAWIREQEPRARALRIRASRIERPRIDLDWH